MKQDAEIALYLKEYDEAEALYRRMDRPDLAIDMHMRLEDWFAVRLPPPLPPFHPQLMPKQKVLCSLVWGLVTSVSERCCN